MSTDVINDALGGDDEHLAAALAATSEPPVCRPST